METHDLWFGTSGPHDAEIVIVGESWGFEEDQAKVPFVGQAGVELRRILAESGIDVSKCLLTNMVAAKPLSNETWRFFNAKDIALPSTYIRGLSPNATVVSEVQRLFEQIKAFHRRLVITTGNWPLWALTSSTKAEVLRSSNNRPIPKDLQPYVPTGIMNWRGSMWYMLKDFRSTEYSNIQLLPIIHPSAILRDWTNRAITVHDLKARVPMALRGDWRQNPKPIFWAPPTYEQAVGRLKMWLAAANAGRKVRLACDIETVRLNSLMTCVGLADSTHFAMCIPFVKKDAATPSGLSSYWSLPQEAIIVQLLQKILTHVNIEIEGQNFIYDIQYFQYWLAVTPKCEFDTMLAQHLLWPGTPKGLDYLSSLYCKYHWFWKEESKEWDTKGSLEQLLEYNCWDLVRTFEAAGVLRNLIKVLGQEAQWEFTKEKQRFCLRMMNRGIRVDRERRAKMAHELGAAYTTIAGELDAIVPQSWVPRGKASKSPWYNSPSQTKYVLTEIMGCKLPNSRSTGNPTTGKDALNDLPKKYPIFSGIFSRLKSARSIDVFQSHFIRAAVDPDSKLRSSFNPAGTETHRLSSSINPFGRGTNMQNIPKGDEE